MHMKTTHFKTNKNHKVYCKMKLIKVLLMGENRLNNSYKIKAVLIK
jgi:hypothetical protein